MLYSNPSFEVTDEGYTKIWRYMDFTKFVSMLDRNALFFIRSDKLSDPFEGSFTKLNLEQRTFNITDDQVQFIRKYDPEYSKRKGHNIISSANKKFKQLIYLNSWHISEHESAAMWKSYLKSDEGIAIQSTLGRLNKSLKETKETIFVGKIKYIDYEKESIPEGNQYYPFLYKRKSFEHEKELRLFLKTPSHVISGDEILVCPDEGLNKDVEWFDENNNLRTGIYVSINLDILIESIYISPTAESWFHDLIKSIMIKYEVKRATAHPAAEQRGMFAPSHNMR